MCGIIGAIHNKKEFGNVNELVINQLEDQLARGQKGFGIVFIGKDGKVTVKRATEITKCLLDLYMTPSQAIFLHHRQPTSSDNKLDQTHPFRISHEELKSVWYIMHNGIISNDKELYKKHTEMGYDYSTAYHYIYSKGTSDIKINDSEAFAIDLARFIEGKSEELESAGSIAFFAIQCKTVKGIDIAQRIHFGRSSNPINMAKTRDKIFLSSEGPGEEIKREIIYNFNLSDLKLYKKKMAFKKRDIINIPTTGHCGTHHHRIGSDWDWRDHYETGSSKDYRDKDKDKDKARIKKGDEEIAIEKEIDDLKEKYQADIYAEIEDLIDQATDIDLLGNDMVHYTDATLAAVKSLVLDLNDDMIKAYDQFLINETSDKKDASEEEQKRVNDIIKARISVEKEEKDTKETIVKGFEDRLNSK